MDKFNEWHDQMLKMTSEFNPDGYTDPGLEGVSEVAPELYEAAGPIIYGGFYSDPIVDLKTRALCTLSALLALQNLPAIKTWIHYLINLGCTRDEIGSIVSQISWYIGVPQASVACNAIREAYDELDQRSS